MHAAFLEGPKVVGIEELYALAYSVKIVAVASSMPKARAVERLSHTKSGGGADIRYACTWRRPRRLAYPRRVAAIQEKGRGRRKRAWREEEQRCEDLVGQDERAPRKDPEHDKALERHDGAPNLTPRRGCGRRR